jgi:uncharacterized membrane protein
MEAKLKSRTFWLAVTWTFLVGVGLVASIFGKVIPLSALIGSAGLVSAAYVGGEKYIDSKKFPYGK